MTRCSRHRRSLSVASRLLSDWQLLVDLGRQQVFQTSLRPDVVLVSEETKNMTILEITVPWEECMEDAFE